MNIILIDHTNLESKKRILFLLTRAEVRTAFPPLSVRSRAVPYGLWWAIRAAAGPQALFELLTVPRDILEGAFAPSGFPTRMGCGFQRAGLT